MGVFQRAVAWTTTVAGSLALGPQNTYCVLELVASELPGSLPEMQDHRLHPRSTERESLF